MNRQERLNALAKLHASMPVEMEGLPDDKEIAFLDKVIEQNLIPVEKTKQQLKFYPLSFTHGGYCI